VEPIHLRRTVGGSGKEVAMARLLGLALLVVAASAPLSGCKSSRFMRNPLRFAAAHLHPPGYVEMKVKAVVPSGGGGALLLTDEREQQVLPIYVGPAEAFALDLRLRHRRYERPLTHDLFDNVIRELDGELIRAQVDELRDGTYYGTVVILGRDRLAALDARPSDAIALALGERVPIYVRREVLDRAGMPAWQLQ
jgi:bifunctional DNase/RNase